MSDDAEQLAQRLRETVDASGLELRELAVYAEMSVPELELALAGKRAVTSLERALIAEKTGGSVTYLLFGVTEEEFTAHLHREHEYVSAECRRGECGACTDRCGVCRGRCGHGCGHAAKAAWPRPAGWHCCEDMALAVAQECPDHEDPFDCPDYLVHFSPEHVFYGLVVHDGGGSAMEIRHCPWCGAALPEGPPEGAEPDGD